MSKVTKATEDFLEDCLMDVEYVCLDGDRIRVTFGGDAEVNLRKMQQIGAWFGTDQVDFTGRIAGRVWSELTSDPGEPATLSIRAWTREGVVE